MAVWRTECFFRHDFQWLLNGCFFGKWGYLLCTKQRFMAVNAPILQIFSVIERTPAIQLDAAGVMVQNSRKPAASQTATSVDIGMDPSQRAVSLKGEIVLDKVKFAYPVRPEKDVLAGLSLTVPAGKTVALVGSSGSGRKGLCARLHSDSAPAVWYCSVNVCVDICGLSSAVGCSIAGRHPGGMWIPSTTCCLPPTACRLPSHHVILSDLTLTWCVKLKGAVQPSKSRGECLFLDHSVRLWYLSLTLFFA